MKTHPLPNRSLSSCLLECIRPAALTLMSALALPLCPAANLDDPTFTRSPYRTPEGITRLQLVGEKDRRYVVRASEDGRQWSPWADFVSAGELTTLQDDSGKRDRMYQVGQVLR